MLSVACLVFSDPTNNARLHTRTHARMQTLIREILEEEGLSFNAGPPAQSDDDAYSERQAFSDGEASLLDDASNDGLNALYAGITRKADHGPRRETNF